MIHELELPPHTSDLDRIDQVQFSMLKKITPIHNMRQCYEIWITAFVLRWGKTKVTLLVKFFQSTTESAPFSDFLAYIVQCHLVTKISK